MRSLSNLLGKGLDSTQLLQVEIHQGQVLSKMYVIAQMGIRIQVTL